MSLVAAQLVARVVADTKAGEEGLARVGQHAQKTGGFLQGVLQQALGIAGGFGIVGVASKVWDVLSGQIGDVFSKTLDAQKVMAQTEAAIKSTGDASGLTASQVADLADHFMQLTGIDDQTIQSAENILLTFTGIGKKAFPQATEAVLDLSTAMHLDLNSAAVMVGKALNDPILGVTTLRRVGVQLSKEQEDQVKHFMAVGDKASAQKIILGELSKEMGGSASAAGKTFSGQLDKLGATFDKIKENIGTAVLPILTKLLGKINDLAQWVGDHLVPKLKELHDWWDKHIVPILNAAKDTIENHLIPAFNDLKDNIEKNVLPKLGKLKDALGSPNDKKGNGIINLFHALSDIIDKVRGSFDGITRAVGTVIEIVTRIVTFIKTQAIPTFQHWWTVLQTKLAPVLRELSGIFQKDILPHLEHIWFILQKDLGPTIADITNKIKKDFGPQLKQLGEIAKLLAKVQLAQFLGIVLLIAGAIDASVTNLDKLLTRLDQLKSKIDSLNLPDWLKGAAGGGYHGFAEGGDTGSGGLAMVGERGPELMVVPPHAHVYTASETQSILRNSTGLGFSSSPGGVGGGLAANGMPLGTGRPGQPIILEIDGRALARVLLPHTVAAIRNRTGVRA